MAPPEEFRLTPDEYKTLSLLAVRAFPSIQRVVDAIDERHGVRTYRLWVRWVPSGKQRYPSQRFPEEWPPKEESVVQVVGRPVAKQDVLDHLKQFTDSPLSVMVTKDPARLVGWTTLEAAFP